MARRTFFDDVADFRKLAGSRKFMSQSDEKVQSAVTGLVFSYLTNSHEDPTRAAITFASTMEEFAMRRSYRRA